MPTNSAKTCVENCNDDQDTNADDLSSKEWYWSAISRTQANDLLHGKRDGTFLVRDSETNRTDYTLTVKKDSVNKMMRIISVNGKYGFHKPPRFDSLSSLIEHHMKHSLAEYYPDMNIKLEHPLSKVDICSNLNVDFNDMNSLIEKLEIAYQFYNDLIKEYDDHHQAYRDCQDDIVKFKQSLHCFEEMFAIFDGQLKLNEEYQKEALEHEKSNLANHHHEIHNKLEEIKDLRNQLELQCEERYHMSTNLDRQINELKPQINEKKRHCEQIKAILENVYPINTDMIERKLASLNTSSHTNQAVAQIRDQKLEFSPPQTNVHYDQVASQKLNYCQIDRDFLAEFAPNSKHSSLGDHSQIESNSKVHNRSSSSRTSFSEDRQMRKQIDDNFMMMKKVTTGAPFSSTTHSIDSSEHSTYLNLDNHNFERLTPLIEADWYMSDISKETAHLLMNNQPDGTFLVRDSKNKDSFTLTVRVNGSTKLLRILQSEDRRRFGFSPDKLEFNTVINLIEFYLREPLIVSKPDLTIRLKYPLSKKQIRTNHSYR